MAEELALQPEPEVVAPAPPPAGRPGGAPSAKQEPTDRTGEE